jgi:hypothetical protein
MLSTRIVGRGIDTLVLNVCYADKQFQPIKQEKECIHILKVKRARSEKFFSFSDAMLRQQTRR